MQAEPDFLCPSYFWFATPSNPNYLPDAMMLVLDNYEQLMKGKTVPVELLKAAADLKVIVTSRIALGVSAEREYPVEPLPSTELPSLGRTLALALRSTTPFETSSCRRTACAVRLKRLSTRRTGMARDRQTCKRRRLFCRDAIFQP